MYGDKNHDGGKVSHSTHIWRTVTEKTKRHEEADDDYLKGIKMDNRK
jgi:hypothetical protein